jgi:uncharacterized RDD family membrane protein YckC
VLRAVISYFIIRLFAPKAKSGKGWAMSLPDDALHIDTPENVVFDYVVAGIASRFMAALVDTILILILQVVTSLVSLLLLQGLGGDPFGAGGAPVGWFLALLGLISFTFLWGYYVFFELLWNGQSPGKRWVGLRVIRTDGMPIGVAESVVRNVVRIVDFLPIYYGIGVVTMFVDSQARRLGDLAAGTIVVRDRGPVTLASLDAEKTLSSPAPRPAASGLGLPVEKLTNADLLMAEDYLRRRSELTNREEMAQRVLQALLERMEIADRPAPHLSSEQLIAQIVQDRLLR